MQILIVFFFSFIKSFPPAVKLGSSSVLIVSIKISYYIVASTQVVVSTDEASFNCNIKSFLPQCDLYKKMGK